jgi:hypothetical protein
MSIKHFDFINMSVVLMIKDNKYLSVNNNDNIKFIDYIDDNSYWLIIQDLDNSYSFVNCNNFKNIIYIQNKIYLKIINKHPYYFKNINYHPRPNEIYFNICYNNDSTLNLQEQINKINVFENICLLKMYDNYEKYICERLSSITYNYNDFIKDMTDKKVCIVGPSSTKNNNQRYFIDNYDFVVRLNKSWKYSNNNNDGYKTDILVNCLDTNPECGDNIPDNEINKIKYLICPYPILFENESITLKNGNYKLFIKLFDYKNINKELKIIIIDKNTYLNLEKEIETKPNTGFLAKYIFSQIYLDELYITGFSFFKNGYDLNYRNNINGIELINNEIAEKVVFEFMGNNHNQENQIKYCKKLFIDNQNNKIKKLYLDPYYKNILEFNKYEDIAFNLNKKILFVIISCQKYRNRIKDISIKWIDNLKKINADYIIVEGNHPNTNIENNILELNVDDTYEYLPYKIYTSFKYLKNNNYLYDYYVKIDDDMTIDIDRLINNTYFGSYDYYGNATGEGKNINRTYHIPFSKIKNKPYDKPWLGPWCSGGCYILSKRSFNILTDDKYNNIFYQEIYEDKCVGDILRENGILPRFHKNFMKHKLINDNFDDNICQELSI